MLYFVATPIGNLKDITYRAVETLNAVDEIGCEDTRRSIVLLQNYGIKKPLFSYHKFNEREESEKIIAKLKDGKNIAVISDAGMPVISDPGNILVSRLIEEGLDFTVIPGANAALSALLLSGLDASRFAFIGFLPEKKSEREELLAEYRDYRGTLIFYCAPHDVKKYCETLYSSFGNRVCVAVKEITKIHERAVRFELKEGFPEEPKGEYVLLTEGKKEEKFTELSEKEHIEKYLEMGLTKKDAIKRAAKDRGVSKSSLYKYTIDER